MRIRVAPICSHGMRRSAAAAPQRPLQSGRKQSSKSSPSTSKARPTSDFGLGLPPLPREISSPSFGHLVSSLSETTPQMAEAGQRIRGQTMDEGSRTQARRVTLAIMGVPVVIGTAVVGYQWLAKREQGVQAG